MSGTDGPDELGHLLRDLAPQVLGAVARRHRDFADAEDAVQEALIAAAERWPTDGIPRNPRGWLYQVAIRRLADQARSEIARRQREDAVATLLASDAAAASPGEFGTTEDDSLILLFMCCHPALTPPTAIALTLRAVGGLTTREIARAFLVPEATIAQRISRAKQSIRDSRIPFALPTDAERGTRLATVLHVLYLVFNEGYTTSAGPALHRTDLSDEAIRLTRMLRQLLPRDAEVGGLLALMLLTDARRRARTGPAGELIPLDEQDRTLWDRSRIAEGVALVREVLSLGEIGPYQIQAAIAAIHDEAPGTEDTDWAEILALYGLLERLTDNPMVALNRAIAAAMVEGPDVGLQLLEILEADGRLAGHYRLEAVRGHLLERVGRPGEAVESYRSAAARTASLPERNYLLTRAARLLAGAERREPPRSPAR